MNREIRKLVGFKKEEAKGSCRNFGNRKVYGLYSASNIMTMMK
jgi:hypothetical protein